MSKPPLFFSTIAALCSVKVYLPSLCSYQLTHSEKKSIFLTTDCKIPKDVVSSCLSDITPASLLLSHSAFITTTFYQSHQDIKYSPATGSIRYNSVIDLTCFQILSLCTLNYHFISSNHLYKQPF